MIFFTLSAQKFSIAGGITQRCSITRPKTRQIFPKLKPSKGRGKPRAANINIAAIVEKAFTATYTDRKKKLKTKQNEIKDESLSQKVVDEAAKQVSGDPAAKEKFHKELKAGKTPIEAMIEAESNVVKDTLNPKIPKL